ncbi:MAG: uracil phosphoribosyltransferase [Bacteriovoracia bacterium]
MIQDVSYEKRDFTCSEIEHFYGPNFHILNSPLMSYELAMLSSEKTKQPMIRYLVESLYLQLLHTVLAKELPTRKTKIKTRMASMHEQGEFEADLFESSQEVICVNLARAGTLPSQICYDHLNYIFDCDKIRQDHIYINRATNEKEQVIGTSLTGHKIGGSIKDAIVLVPDPMGATGNTICAAANLYRHLSKGDPRKLIAIHLIITPEYVRKIKEEQPGVIVYAIRLDRGFSDTDVLKAPPGKFLAREKGLNEKHYIVPGAGGLGEILNNAFV